MREAEACSWNEVLCRCGRKSASKFRENSENALLDFSLTGKASVRDCVAVAQRRSISLAAERERAKPIGTFPSRRVACFACCSLPSPLFPSAPVLVLARVPLLERRLASLFSSLSKLRETVAPRAGQRAEDSFRRILPLTFLGRFVTLSTSSHTPVCFGIVAV